MKLIACLVCNDVYNLGYKEKTCSCGKTKGKYTDNLNAIYEGESAIPLGIDNLSFREAVYKQPLDGQGERFTAFVIPEFCDTFTKTNKK